MTNEQIRLALLQALADAWGNRPHLSLGELLSEIVALDYHVRDLPDSTVLERLTAYARRPPFCRQRGCGRRPGRLCAHCGRDLCEIHIRGHLQTCAHAPPPPPVAPGPRRPPDFIFDDPPDWAVAPAQPPPPPPAVDPQLAEEFRRRVQQYRAERDRDVVI